MEETTVLEEETLNQVAEPEAIAEEEVKTTYTAEEVETMKKELQSNTEKGVQKLIKEKKEAEETYQNVLSEISQIAEDKTRLVDLFDENPKVAKIILDKYYDWQSISEYKTNIWYEEDYTDPKKIQKQIEEQAKKLSEQKEIEREKKSFIDKLQMSKEEVEKFEEAFEERKELRSFKIEDLEKHLTKAYREISDNTESVKTMKSQETIAKNMATWEWKGWNDTSGRKPNVAIQNLLRDHWVI